jgi:hypothetical protein
MPTQPISKPLTRSTSRFTPSRQFWRTLGVAGAAMICASFAMRNEAAAQTQQPIPEIPAPSGQLPQSETAPAHESLGEQLSRSKGLIKPPDGLDAGIEAPAPQPNPGTTPVIPPPGTPGGDPSAEPK